MICSKVAPASSRLLLFLLPHWQIVAIMTCSGIAPASHRLLLFLQLRWQVIAILACSTAAPVLLRYPLCLQLHWRLVAISPCSEDVLVSNSRPPRLENIRRNTVYLLPVLVRLQKMLLLICSPLQEAPSLELLLSTRLII